MLLTIQASVLRCLRLCDPDPACLPPRCNGSCLQLHALFWTRSRVQAAVALAGLVFDDRFSCAPLACLATLCCRLPQLGAACRLSCWARPQLWTTASSITPWSTGESFPNVTAAANQGSCSFQLASLWGKGHWRCNACCSSSC